MTEDVVIRHPDGREFLLPTDDPARRWRDEFAPAGFVVVRGTVPGLANARQTSGSKPTKQSAAKRTKGEGS